MSEDKNRIITRQFLITPSAGKRLISKSMLIHPEIKKALKESTIVIIAGTTNGYIAEEILSEIGQLEGFSRKRFFRGITPPPKFTLTEAGRLQDESKFPGDVVIVKGVWQRGKTIYDVVDDLKKDDIIIKGANALDLLNKQAAIYIGDPMAGTINLSLQAVLGRRTRLIIPVGLEKRVCDNLNSISKKLNRPASEGPRFLPVPGEVISEIEAIKILTGADAELVAAGGVCGAEGACWIAVSGKFEKVDEAGKIIKSISNEERFEL